MWSTDCLHSLQVCRWGIIDVFSNLARFNSLNIDITLFIGILGHADELNLCGLSTSLQLFLLRYDTISHALQRFLLLNHPLDNLLLDQFLIFIEILLKVLETTADTGSNIVSWTI